MPGIACLTPAHETARVRLNAATARERYRTVHVYLPGSFVSDVVDEYRRIGQTVVRLAAAPWTAK